MQARHTEAGARAALTRLSLARPGCVSSLPGAGDSDSTCDGTTEDPTADGAIPAIRSAIRRSPEFAPRRSLGP